MTMAEKLNILTCKNIITPPLPQETVQAMAYIPYQQFEEPYSEEEGYTKGTIFPTLDKPFGKDVL